jgi:phosphoribosylformylglycinamidine synthase
MVGLLSDVSLVVPTRFVEGCSIVILGDPPLTLGSSEYWAESHEFPHFDLAAEGRLGEALRALAARRLLVSAQDVADGGLGVALAECALLGECGASVMLDGSLDVALFSEDQGRAIVTCHPDDVAAVSSVAEDRGVQVARVGSTGGDRLVINNIVELELVHLRTAWDPAP